MQLILTKEEKKALNRIMPYTKKTNKNYLYKVEGYIKIAVEDISSLIKNPYQDDSEMMFSAEAVRLYPDCAKEDYELYATIWGKVRICIINKSIGEMQVNF